VRVLDAEASFVEDRESRITLLADARQKVFAMESPSPELPPVMRIVLSAWESVGSEGEI